MRGAIPLGRLAGIQIYVHWTFALLLIYAGSSGYSDGLNIWQILIGIVFILAVFGCVTLHELGHALAARRYGIATHDIILLPIGGVARLAGMPEKPLHEIVVAVAGPLVNVVIALLLQVVLYVTAGLWVWQLPYTAFFESFWLAVLLTNLMLVVFNAIPAFPMDGGRVLRATLAMFMNRPLATRIAATIGQILAVGFAIFGYYNGRYGLILTGMFIFWAAGAESRNVQLEAKRNNAADDTDDDEVGISMLKIAPTITYEARRLMDKLALNDRQCAVGKVESSTGIILQNNGERYRGVGDIYTVFDSFEEAQTFAIQQIQQNHNLKCWIENKDNEVMLLYRTTEHQ